MRRRKRIWASALLLLPTLAACDGRSDVEEAVARTLPVPSSARFQSVREEGDYTCGEVNSENSAGGMTGYRRFVFDSRTRVAMIDAGREVDFDAPLDAAACNKPQSYQTVAERLSCASAPDLQGRQERQRAFAQTWARVCA